MKLEDVVPWGRNLSEYREMFLYSDADNKKKILGCGDGPASVNSELTKMGIDITSIDPIYQFNKSEIVQRVDLTASVVGEQLRKNQNDFVWKSIKSVDLLIEIRLSAMSGFLEDYEKGKREKRYLHQELPKLEFKDDSFDLVWSSHFLFLYSEYFDEEFHKNAILEMLRVAKEVRIFPLLDLKNKISPHLNPTLKFLGKLGFTYEIIQTEYEFQKGANKILIIQKF